MMKHPKNTGETDRAGRGSKPIRYLPLLLACLISWAGPISAQQETLRLNTAFVHPVRTIFELAMKEAFARKGLEVSVHALPAERALCQANSGKDDGDGPRVAGLTAMYPNLIQVPEKLTEAEFVGFSKDPTIRTENWESLKPYKVGIIRGWKILENHIENTKSLEIAGDSETLFRILEHGRIDIAVINEIDGMAIVRQKQHEDVRLLEPPLAKREMFLYLHKKHEALVPKIASALKDMKADGTYRHIVDQVIKKRDIQ